MLRTIDVGKAAYVLNIYKPIITLNHTNLETEKESINLLTRFYYEEKFINIARRRSFVDLMPK